MNALATEWLDELATVPHSSPQETHWTDETEEIEEAEETDDVRAGIWVEIKDAIKQCTLKAAHTSNSLLFKLARRFRGIEKRYAFRGSPLLLRRIFEQWHRASEKYLKPHHDYFLEFLDKLQLVRHPFGETLIAALERAEQKPPPFRVLLLNDPDAHRVASLCRELQCIAGKDPFYLIGRACATLLGRSHSTVARWLRAFQTLRIIRLKEKGRQGRGSRYIYIAD